MKLVLFQVNETHKKKMLFQNDLKNNSLFSWESENAKRSLQVQFEKKKHIPVLPKVKPIFHFSLDTQCCQINSIVAKSSIAVILHGTKTCNTSENYWIWVDSKEKILPGYEDV